MPLQAGDMLHGQYQILAQIRRGGFGYVYHARDVHVHGDVAIKELIPSLVRDEAMLRCFLAEAKATMRLSHEHIARTHTVFLEDGNYSVMECMAGDSLEFCLRPFLFPEERG
jgi:serine/threonine protein kinase